MPCFTGKEWVDGFNINSSLKSRTVKYRTTSYDCSYVIFFLFPFLSFLFFLIKRFLDTAIYKKINQLVVCSFTDENEEEIKIPKMNLRDTLCCCFYEMEIVRSVSVHFAIEQKVKGKVQNWQFNQLGRADRNEKQTATIQYFNNMPLSLSKYERLPQVRLQGM